MDFDRLRMTRSGSVPAAAWNALLDAVKTCYLSEFIGGKIRRHGPHTILEADQTSARGGATASSWKLSIRPVAESDPPEYEWSVSSERSVITDGTNGSPVDLGPSGTAWKTGAIKFDTSTDGVTETTYIVLEADVDADLSVSDWTLAATTDPIEAREVVIEEPEEDEPERATKARLYIGKIGIAEGIAAVTQAATLPQLIDHGFVNGMAARVFIPHPYALDAPPPEE
jgi:hypothetical protein